MSPMDPRGLPVKIRTVAPRHSAALWLRTDERSGDDRNTILVFRRATATRLEQLRAEDRNFIDVGRDMVRLHLPWLVVDRTGVRVPALALPPSERAFRDPFGDRASLVTRLLIEQPDRAWGAREIAEAAGVSTMTASHVLRQLRELGVVDVSMRGRTFDARLRDLTTLVERWARQYEWTQSPNLTIKASVGSPDRFLRRLDAALHGRRWALTLQAGASLVVPHASWDTVHVYVDVPDIASLGKVAHAAGWEIGPGKVVLMRPWYAHSAWVGVRSVDDINVVSDLQLVLDLWHYPVRGREEASVLLAAMEQRFRVARGDAS